MVRNLAFLAVVAASALALGACASHSATSVNSKQVAKNNSKQQMICTSAPSLGSHIPKTICMTEQQYKEVQKSNAQSRKSLQEMQQNNRSTCTDTGGCPPLL